MADQNPGSEPNHDDPVDTQSGAGARSAAGADTASSAGADAQPDPARLAERLAEVESQLEHHRDQALRWQAESENSRRRAAREVENAHKYALEKFTAELLPVLDSLEKAVETARAAAGDAQAAEAAGSAAAAAVAIAEGVELSLKLFRDVLEKSGVTLIDPHGAPFDPQLHEAMAMVENPAVEPNSVIDVMQKGYSLNGRLVRAAKVIVSKSGG
jgi:molecular chaperone GrpE